MDDAQFWGLQLSTSDVGEVTGLPQHQVSHWAKEFLGNAGGGGRGVHRTFGLAEVVALAYAGQVKVREPEGVRPLAGMMGVVIHAVVDLGPAGLVQAGRTAQAGRLTLPVITLAATPIGPRYTLRFRTTVSIRPQTSARTPLDLGGVVLDVSHRTKALAAADVTNSAGRRRGVVRCVAAMKAG